MCLSRSLLLILQRLRSNFAGISGQIPNAVRESSSFLEQRIEVDVACWNGAGKTANFLRNFEKTISQGWKSVGHRKRFEVAMFQYKKITAGQSSGQYALAEYMAKKPASI